MTKAVFLDRDGVINIDYGYVGKISDFHFIEGVVESLAALKKAGFLLILVTNQSGIARGFYSEEDFHNLTAYMQDELAKEHASFDGIYYCPHHPKATLLQYRKECTCRKPQPGMILKARDDFKIDLSKSIMIGDHAGDLLAAKAAGIPKLCLVGEHIATEREKIDGISCFESLKKCTAELLSQSR